MRLFAGDDWAEDHHDVEVMDEAGGCWRKGGCRRARPGSRSCMSWSAGTCRGCGGCGGGSRDRDRPRPWVAALVAAGYTVYPVNPLQASRYRDRHGVSGAKSDGGDSHARRHGAHRLPPAAPGSRGQPGGCGGQGGGAHP